ncbi:MAG: major capsid protein [Arizlama microvirus]|nr:MAG: major capsid protein [Arizlama microvirus]
MKRKDNVFASNALSSIQRSRFDHGHERKFTGRMGELITACVLEALPSDVFRIDYVNMLRFLPLVAPVMHKVKVKTEYFFCPSRIVWEGFEGAITGTSDEEWPYILIDGVVGESTVADHLGIPPGDYSAGPLRVSAIPFACYYKIFDEWYRDQNLVSTEFVPLVPGDNTAAYGKALTDRPLHRAWEHDYFTAALPFTQQGQDVEIPLTNGDPLDVYYENNGLGANQNVGLMRRASDGTIMTAPSDIDLQAGPTPITASVHTTGTPSAYDPAGTLKVDPQLEAATINDLREAFSLQAFFERCLRGGQRYFEQLWSHFRQKSPDMRLQRPEVIGMDVQNMVISEVLQTAQTVQGADGANITSPVGQLSGHGISVGSGRGMSYQCQEHGYVMGMISVIPDTAYQQGIPKHFFKDDRLDFPWPDFANLGEQPIFNKEIYALDAPGYNKEGIFGYLPIYANYRYTPSYVSGAFGSSLSFWTLGRIFDTPPALNADFVTCDPSTRIFAVEDEDTDHVLFNVFNAHTIDRPLPRYSVPSTLR